MLTPPVGRGSSSHRLAVGLFSLGSVFGGVFTASGVWLLGGLVAGVTGPLQAVALVSAGLVGLLRDFDVVSFPLPARNAQVPQLIFGKGRARAALQFGFEMGTGVRTYMTATVPYVLAAVVLLSHAGFVLAAGCGAGFGAGRALVPVLRLMSRRGTAWEMRLAAQSRMIVRGSAVAAFVAALAMAVLGFSGR
jgi:hypothetical protein